MGFLDGAAKIKQVGPLKEKRRVDLVFRELVFKMGDALVNFRFGGIRVGIVHRLIPFLILCICGYP
jgi:hypothetical protein